VSLGFRFRFFSTNDANKDALNQQPTTSTTRSHSICYFELVKKGQSRTLNSSTPHIRTTAGLLPTLNEI
jgi:hypothetical protein